VTIVLYLSLFGLSTGLILCAVRVLQGPTVADRVVALDSASTLLIGILVVGSMLLGSGKYLTYALLLAVLSYVSTVAFAKYIERGVIIERDTD
jgi:multicomponent Na+:H+ antiporter subunit F